ncbi:MAG: chromosome segregation protein SMC [Christensenellales bacterium]
MSGSGDPVYLKSIEMVGFKSFAKKTTIHLEKGITAIVGPNGSGKSNVSDAVRWVLGEQSAKSLRGANMQDVIFGGTQTRKPMGYCEVTLVFDNTDNFLPTDYSEVSVTRRAYRNGDNEYMINRSSCRLKDILSLFHNTGIGKDGYSFIGQGRINDILSPKSEDRRMVLEEAAGITRYKVRKTEAEQKLEHTNSNLQRVNDIIAELHDQIGPLEQQSKEARKYFQFRDELKHNEVNLFLYRYEKSVQRIEQLQSQIAAIQDEYDQTHEQFTSVTTAENEAYLRELDQKLSAARDEITALKTKLVQFEGSNQLFNEKISNASKESQRIADDLDVWQKAIAALLREKEEAEANISAVKAEKDDADKEQAKLSAHLQIMLSELKQAETELDQKKEQLFASMNAAVNAKSSLEKFQNIQSSVLERMDAVEREISKTIQEQNDLESERKRSDKVISDLADGKKLITEDLRQKTEQYNRLLLTVEENNRKQNECKSSMNVAASRLAMLEEMKQNYEGFSYSVRKLLSDAENKPELKRRISGVIGNVVKAPQNMELAIETALGAALQNIITETEDDAKILIEHLRSNNYGRATFMPLSAAKPRLLNAEEKRFLSDGGVIGVASELVQCDKRFAGAVASVLGRVVIVDHLSSGIALIKRCSYAFRVVTLEGDVLSPGGTITGGSVNNKQVGGLLRRDRAIEEEQKKQDQLKASFTELIKKLDACNIELNSSLSQIEKCKNVLHEADVNIAREKEKQDTLIFLEQKNKEKADGLKLEQSQLCDTIQEIQAKLEKMQKAQEQFNKDNTLTHADIAGYQNAVLEKRKQCDDCSGDLSALQFKCHSYGSRLEMLVSGFGKQQAEIDRLESNSRNANLQKEQAEREVHQLAAAQTSETVFAAEGQIQLQSLLASLQKLEKEKEAAFSGLQETNAKRDSYQEVLTEILERRHKAEMQISKIESDLSSLQEKIWDDYELTYGEAQQFKEPIAVSQAQNRVFEIREAMRAMGPINPNAVDDYNSASSRLAFLSNQKTDLEKARDDLLTLINELIATMRIKFKTECEKINQNFNTVFAHLFNGGSASIAFLDDDVLESRIDIEAQPPGKKLQSISLLSGGEKSLVAIALLFAILSLRPAAFCILDEVDTSLDDANVNGYASYLNKYADKTQFVLITHRKNAMEVCDTLYGVAMVEKGVSELVAVRLSDIAS